MPHVVERADGSMHSLLLMQSDGTVPSSLSADDFFGLVEATLTAPMAALGFGRIHGSVNDQPSSRSKLTTTGESTTELPFLWFQFGYEAGSDEVELLVNPGDEPVGDEWWVNYAPATGCLELRAWEPVASGRVDWDIWLDDGPCSVPEVKRRLAAVGQAVTAFVAERGGFPVTN
jgi:hypothetical protein